MITVLLATTMLLSDLFRQFAPDARIRTLDWCRREIYNESGKPYNHNGYPHLGAPGGPFDANDDPQINIIVEQFATRLGKTFAGQCIQLKAADTAPAPMMFVSSVEKLAAEIVSRTYGMIERSRALKGQMVPERLRRRDQIELDNCRVFVGWARSVNTLADKNIKYGHGNEIDKWERLSTSKEADPLDLFMDRSKDFPSYKYVLEGTPTIAEVSRVERMMLRSNYCRFHVPCPHCKHYQTLKFARIEWDRLPNGHHDIDLAKYTARYLCDNCNERCQDHHRAWMMRHGVWLPDGCGIDHDAAIEVAATRLKAIREGTFSDQAAGRFWKQGYAIGEPNRDGHIAGFQLSSLYALSLTWGRIAAEWVSVHDSPNQRRNFVNSWLAETWRVEKRTEKWEALARRMIVSVDKEVAPLWASLVTMGIDRQQDCYKWIVQAWGPGGSSHTMAYGSHESLQWIVDNLVKRKWAHADGGTISVVRTLVDSGFDPKEPYTVSRDCLMSNPRITLLCCKGSNRPLNSPFKINELGPDTLMPGLPLVMIDTDWTQNELERQLFDVRPGAEGSTSVYFGTPEEHESFLREVLNDQPEVSTDKHNNVVVAWNRATDSHPNDFRDCMRYAMGAQMIWSEGQPIPQRAQMLAWSQPAPPAAPPITTPDGRPFVASANV